MGISGRQDRKGRNPRGRAEPGGEGGAGNPGEGTLSRAVHLCFAYLWRISPFDAALYLPPLGRNSLGPDACGHQVGAARRFAGERRTLADARSRLAAYSDAARSAVTEFAADTGGATAIE